MPKRGAVLNNILKNIGESVVSTVPSSSSPSSSQAPAAPRVYPKSQSLDSATPGGPSGAAPRAGRPLGMDRSRRTVSWDAGAGGGKPFLGRNFGSRHSLPGNASPLAGASPLTQGTSPTQGSPLTQATPLAQASSLE